jgi:putative DNA methylase
MPKKHRNFQPPVYGMDNLGDIFTPRQLVALTTFSDLVGEVRERIHQDALMAGLPKDPKGLDSGGLGAQAYADAIATILAIALDKLIDYGNTICLWNPVNQNIGHLFTKQAIPMSWDFVEMDPIEGALSFDAVTEGVARTLENMPSNGVGQAFQADCAELNVNMKPRIISTDPPYYDNICYADLSDFFYVWLRRSLQRIFPLLFSTISVPKKQEIIAASNRHNNSEEAEGFFLDGMKLAMRQISLQTHPSFPVSIYYAFKQSETGRAGTSSPGWETFLDAVLLAGFAVLGTWPLRTERATRAVGQGANALASSIVLVCRKRSADAPSISRREFIRELNGVLPEALDEMTKGSGDERSPVAPVDLSQAIIGPGMAVFSKYSAVLEADGTPMTVKTALQLINRFLAEDDFDADTQFCSHWFEQYGWESGKFGEADTLARAKGTSVDGVKQAGVLHAAGGNVRLLKWSEYASEWDPQVDQRLPIWEVLHQLIRVFNTDGETGAATVFAAVQSKAEAARQLAYRLYTLCERKNWAEDARAYNEVVSSWSGIESAAAKEPAATQRTLFDE